MSITQNQGTDTPARWSAGGVFLEALATRDYEALATTLSADVRFRAMLPSGIVGWTGADQVAAIFRSWFGDADDFESSRPPSAKYAGACICRGACACVRRLSTSASAGT